MNSSDSLRFENDAVNTLIDLRVYRLAAIKKAAYRVASTCTAIIGAPEDERVSVSFRFKPGTSETSALDAVRVFFQEALDQELREALAEELAPMRALILAQAFSKTDLIKRD